MMLRALFLSVLVMLARTASAQDRVMTADRLVAIILDLDPDATVTPRGVELLIEDIPVMVMMAPDADRMRAMVPIASVQDVSAQEMERMMQANFGAALEAHDAIAQGILWAGFIQPLGPLEKDQFISGLGQMINLGQSLGSLYSGGALQYGGGDGGTLHRELIDDLLKKGEQI